MKTLTFVLLEDSSAGEAKANMSFEFFLSNIEEQREISRLNHPNNEALVIRTTNP